VSSSGVISWTNDGGRSNPTSVNIKGPKGDTGAVGPTGPAGGTGPQGPKGDPGLFYGVCSTADTMQIKSVSVSGITSLETGLCVRVLFQNRQNYNGVPKLNVNSLGAKDIKRLAGTNAARYEWQAGEVLDLVFDGTCWVIVDGGLATTTYYGLTRLVTSASSASGAYALTPSSLNSFWLNLISNYPVYSASSAYAVGDRVRYGYNVWECRTAITAAEAWTEAHWTKLPALLDLIEARIPAVYTGTLTAAGWSGSAAPYSCTLTVNGILASDKPVVDVVMSGTYASDMSRKEAWAAVYRAVTSANTVTFYAEEKPGVDLPVQIMCVR
ncbi:MAG: hypothetical protein Q4E45_10120, partial [Eubacteriales bacterium]|nr:hypothetical protein [Eubacteriales bacterium]